MPTTNDYDKHEEQRNLANEEDRKATNVGIGFVAILAFILFCSLLIYFVK